MIKIIYDSDKFKDCKTIQEVWKVMNIGEGTAHEFTDKEIFGEKANYENLFMSDDSFELAYDSLSQNDKHKQRARNGNVWSPQAVNWAWYSPMSSGPRFEAIEEKYGKLDDSVLLILTPEDPEYHPAPDLTQESYDE